MRRMHPRDLLSLYYQQVVRRSVSYPGRCARNRARAGWVPAHLQALKLALRILIADGHDQVRFALRVLLTQQPELQVVGKASDGVEMLAQAGVNAADLALVDWALPGLA